MMDAPDESGTPAAEHEAALAAADRDGRLGCVGVEETTAVREIQSEKETSSSDDEHDAEDDGDDDQELQPDLEHEDELAGDEAASPELNAYANAAVPVADIDPLEISRRMMYTRYAQAVPSVQQEIAVGLHGQTSCFTHEDDDGTARGSEFQFCASGLCQQQMQRKDARIMELQCALDHMVQAMTIQQHDIAAQRMFLAKQADHLTKLSMSLHQEKLALQVDRARHVRSRSNSRCSTPRASTNTRGEVTTKHDSVYGFGPSPKASLLPQKSSLSVDTALEANPTVVSASEVFYSTSTVEQTSSDVKGEGNLIDAIERCASLSAIEYRSPIETDFERFTRSQSTRALRPETSDVKPPLASFEPTLSDVNLNDSSTCETASVYSQSSSSSLLVFTHNGDCDSTVASEKMELMSDVPLGTSSKKIGSVSFGQRLRSIRWKV